MLLHSVYENTLDKNTKARFTKKIGILQEHGKLRMRIFTITQLHTFFWQTNVDEVVNMFRIRCCIFTSSQSEFLRNYILLAVSEIFANH